MKKVVRLTESDLIRIVQKVINEQSSDMMSFEKVFDVPNTTKDVLFNMLKSNRELIRSAKLNSEVQGQQLNLQKNIIVDKNMYKLINKNPFSPNGCYYGTLQFDITVIIKDNKYKIIFDNFIWSNQQTSCEIKHSLNPITNTKPKGMTISQYWENFSQILPKYSENLFNQINSTLSSPDF